MIKTVSKLLKRCTSLITAANKENVADPQPLAARLKRKREETTLCALTKRRATNHRTLSSFQVLAQIEQKVLAPVQVQTVHASAPSSKKSDHKQPAVVPPKRKRVEASPACSSRKKRATRKHSTSLDTALQSEKGTAGLLAQKETALKNVFAESDIAVSRPKRKREEITCCPRKKRATSKKQKSSGRSLCQEKKSVAVLVQEEQVSVASSSKVSDAAHPSTVPQRIVDDAEQGLLENPIGWNSFTYNFKIDDRTDEELQLFCMAMDARSDNFARERRLHFQPSVDPAVRWWLIDWLMDVCVENQIGRDTFHGAIQYLDILLCIRSFDGVFYQFAAATALMVAQKTHNYFHLPTRTLLEFLRDDDKLEEENERVYQAAKDFVLQLEAQLFGNNFVNALHPTCVDFLKGAFQFATLVDKRDPQRLPGAEPMPHGLFDGYRKERCKTFFHPKFNGMLFAKACSVMDKVVMDSRSTNFPPSMIASSVFWKVYPLCQDEATYELNHEMSLNIFYLSTGYQLEELRECLHLVSQYQISSIHRILELPNIANMILDNSAKETQINIQDHQLPIDMEFSEFANLINIGKPPSSKPSR